MSRRIGEALGREMEFLRKARYEQVLLLLLPLIMLVAVTQIFAKGVLDDIPVAVVDQDHSSLSRQIRANMAASPDIELLAMPAAMGEAHSLSRSGKVFAIVEIPEGAEGAMLRLERRPIMIYYNAALRTTGGAAASALEEVIADAVRTRGLSLRTADGLEGIELSMPSVQVTAVGNAQKSFERFLTPLILPAIFNLLLSCAAVAAVGRELRAGNWPGWCQAYRDGFLAALIGKLIPYVLVFFAWHLIFWCWMTGVRGWPIMGNTLILVLGQLLLCMATAAIGAALVGVCRDINTALALSTVYASGAVTYSDGTLPVLHANWWAHAWANAMPYTHYYRLQVEQVNLGSDPLTSLSQLLILSAYIVPTILLAAWLLGRAADKGLPREEPLIIGFRGGASAFYATLATVAGNRSILATMCLAVVLYSFYYPAAYQSQVSTKLPVTLVDLDRSTLSREFESRLQATRSIDIVNRVDAVTEALHQLRNRRVDAVIIIDENLRRNARHGNGGLAIYLSAAYLVRAADIGTAVNETLRATVTSLDAANLAVSSGGLSSTEKWPLYNVSEGYGSFAVPAVASLIVQQTLLFGTAMLIGLWRERGIRWLTPPEFLGCWAALTLLGLMTSLYMYGYAFWWQDYPRGGNWPALLVLMVPFTAATSALGLLFGSILDRMDRAMQMYAGISVALFFVAGASIPQFAMPDWLVWVSSVFPSTTMVVGFIKANAAGASFSELSMEFARITALAIGLGLLALWRFSGRKAPLGLDQQASD